MKRHQFTFLFIAILLLAFNACTIEKRSYLPGYHVEWKNNNRTVDQKELRNNKTMLAANHQKVFIEQSKNQTARDSASNLIVDHNLVASVNENMLIVENKKEENWALSYKRKSYNKDVKMNIAVKSKTKKDRKTISTTKEKESEINIAALFSFLFSIAIILSPLSLLFGVIAMRQFKANPNKYKGKFMAIFGVIIGYLASFILLGMAFYAASWAAIFIIFPVIVIAYLIFCTVILVLSVI